MTYALFPLASSAYSSMPPLQPAQSPISNEPVTFELPSPPIALSSAGENWNSPGAHVSQNPTTLTAPGATSFPLTV
jgi:hypothetical protein